MIRLPISRGYVALLAALACAAPSARADLLVYEGFTGYNPGLLAGQNPTTIP